MRVWSNEKSLTQRCSRNGSRREGEKEEYGRENDQNSVYSNNPHGHNSGCLFVYRFISHMETYSAWRALHLREYSNLRSLDDPHFSAPFPVAHDRFSLVAFMGKYRAAPCRKPLDPPISCTHVCVSSHGSCDYRYRYMGFLPLLSSFDR